MAFLISFSVIHSGLRSSRMTKRERKKNMKNSTFISVPAFFIIRIRPLRFSSPHLFQTASIGIAAYHWKFHKFPWGFRFDCFNGFFFNFVFPLFSVIGLRMLWTFCVWKWNHFNSGCNTSHIKMFKLLPLQMRVGGSSGSSGNDKSPSVCWVRNPLTHTCVSLAFNECCYAKVLISETIGKIRRHSSERKWWAHIK